MFYKIVRIKVLTSGAIVPIIYVRGKRSSKLKGVIMSDTKSNSKAQGLLFESVEKVPTKKAAGRGKNAEYGELVEAFKVSGLAVAEVKIPEGIKLRTVENGLRRSLVEGVELKMREKVLYLVKVVKA